MEKSVKVLKWALVIILALLFISSGYPKIIPGESMIERFSNWGYSKGFAQMIGLIELLGGVLLLLPRVSFYASLVLSFIMLGAVYTHISTGIGSPWFAIITALLLMLTAYLLKRDDTVTQGDT
ncbi:MAG: DoxX family protein [Balneolaceae bacterium]